MKKNRFSNSIEIFYTFLVVFFQLNETSINRGVSSFNTAGSMSTFLLWKLSLLDFMFPCTQNNIKIVTIVNAKQKKFFNVKDVAIEQDVKLSLLWFYFHIQLNFHSRLNFNGVILFLFCFKNSSPLGKKDSHFCLFTGMSFKM